jgi:hypothetical protein
MSDDFDFGFSLVDETELEAVQKATVTVQTASSTVEHLQEKVDKMYNMVMPLLNNLQQNPEKSYVYWPDRALKVEVFRDKLTAVYNQKV